MHSPNRKPLQASVIPLARRRQPILGRIRVTLPLWHFLAALVAALITVGAPPAAAQAQFGGVLEQLGMQFVRERCEARCTAAMDEELDICNKTYPWWDLWIADPLDPFWLVVREDWSICVAEALADYSQCVKACPPFLKEIPFPFGSGQ